MITTPMDVLAQFPVRKSKKQKQAFREAVMEYLRSLGYCVRIEQGQMGANNIVVGDPQQAKYLVTAHYDTPARMFLPNFITPCNFLVYLLYQFLVVGVFLLVAFVLSFAAMLLTQNEGIALIAAYVGYFGLLFLMMFGPANPNNANDNTSGVVTLLEICKTMPESHRNRVCFVLFDLEEAGLVGSASYRKSHKTATENQIVLNLDCVGDGDELMMFPNKAVKKDEAAMAALSAICGNFGTKSINLHRKGFCVCPSDHRHFPKGIGIMAFRRMKGIGLYCDKIHTNRDTVLEQTNVNILRAAIVSLICQ